MAITNKVYHITWVTYYSRIGNRKTKRNRKLEGIFFDSTIEVEVTKYISEIINENNWVVFAYNICGDHIHIVLCCNPDHRSNIVRKLKGKSSQMFKTNNNIEVPYHLWAQKYNYVEIKDYKQLLNTIEYINENRQKHSLPENKGLQPLVQEMVVKPFLV